MTTDTNQQDPTPSIGSVLAAVADLRARMDARMDEHGAELVSAGVAVMDRLRRLQEGVDTLSSAGIGAGVAGNAGDPSATQASELISKGTGRPIDDEVESLRRAIAGLRAELAALSEQFSVLFRKARRTDERLAALEARRD